jgi:hypothetical protein
MKQGGGQRLGCKFLLDDGSLAFVHESEITSEIETLMASLGSPTPACEPLDHASDYRVDSEHPQPVKLVYPGAGKFRLDRAAYRSFRDRRKDIIFTMLKKVVDLQSGVAVKAETVGEA